MLSERLRAPKKKSEEILDGWIAVLVVWFYTRKGAEMPVIIDYIHDDDGLEYDPCEAEGCEDGCECPPDVDPREYYLSLIHI